MKNNKQVLGHYDELGNEWSYYMLSLPLDS